MNKVAILGARGYVGKSLAREFVKETDFKVTLFARKSDKKLNIKSISDFSKGKYDTIINCTGIGNKALKNNQHNIFAVTEEVDYMLEAYQKQHPKTLCIHMSSGAVYKKIDLNNIGPADFYAVAKINSEARHRAFPSLSIVDLRIFSFFSQYIDPEAGFFMSDVVACLKSKKVLETSADDIVRDYVCPHDLVTLIKSVIKKSKINDFFDVYSKAPVSKFELLECLKEEYGLKYKIKKNFNSQTPTGAKSAYHTQNTKAKILGYKPKFTSLQGIENELKKCDIL